MSELLKNPNIEPIDIEGKKIAFLSDLHLGDGEGADNFRYNETALKAALEEYEKNGYELALLGDIEEFWQFNLERIRQRYDPTIYSLIRKIGDKRVRRVFGNHDIEWSSPDDPARNTHPQKPLASEALKFRDKDDNVRILAIHGHQGSIESDKNSWFSRFFVKLYAATVESVLDWLGVRQEPSATKSQVATDYEKIMYSWAKENKIILICGHSHRAIFASKTYLDELKDSYYDYESQTRALGADPKDKKKLKEILKKKEETKRKIDDEVRKKREIIPLEAKGNSLLPCFFNTGCGLYTDGITAIEIEDDEIRLVKWNKEGIRDSAFARKKGSMSKFIEKISQ